MPYVIRCFYRYYIQPQWIYDCVNFRQLLPVEDYFIGASLPPHISPFVTERPGDYIPPERQMLLALEQGEELTGFMVFPLCSLFLCAKLYCFLVSGKEDEEDDEIEREEEEDSDSEEEDEEDEDAGSASDDNHGDRKKNQQQTAAVEKEVCYTNNVEMYVIDPLNIWLIDVKCRKKG